MEYTIYKRTRNREVGTSYIIGTLIRKNKINDDIGVVVDTMDRMSSISYSLKLIQLLTVLFIILIYI